MMRKFFLSLICLIFSGGFIFSQFISTSDLFHRSENNSRAGKLNIVQVPEIDTLITKYILAKKYMYDDIGYYGMDGFRIQIYNSSNRNAREESAKIRAALINSFPDIVSYLLYADPGYFKVRVGDFRTKTEAIKLFLKISKEFPESYIVPDIINFPDQNIK